MDVATANAAAAAAAQSNVAVAPPPDVSMATGSGAGGESSMLLVDMAPPPPPPITRMENGRVIDRVDKPFVYGTAAFWLGNKAPTAEMSHKWTVFLRGLENEDLSYFVEKVSMKTRAHAVGFFVLPSCPQLRSDNARSRWKRRRSKGFAAASS
jgi:hypothetical protein